MKKLLKATLILACAGWVHADIAVTQGSGKTVHTDTVNNLEYQVIKIIDGTTGGTSSATVTSAGALSGNIAQIAGATVGTGASGIMKVALTDGSGNSITSAASALAVLASQSGAWAITNTTIAVVSPTGQYLNTAEEITVTSTTIPVAAAQGSTLTLRGDSVGRTLVTGMPYGVISTTWSVNVSTGTGEILLISSPTAPSRIFMCGCILKNNSTTNTGITIYDKTGTVNSNAAFPLGAPANYVNGGIWPGCSQPFFFGSPGGQITFIADAAATSTKLYCQYYTSQ